MASKPLTASVRPAGQRGVCVLGSAALSPWESRAVLRCCKHLGAFGALWARAPWCGRANRRGAWPGASLTAHTHPPGCRCRAANGTGKHSWPDLPVVRASARHAAMGQDGPAARPRGLVLAMRISARLFCRCPWCHWAEGKNSPRTRHLLTLMDSFRPGPLHHFQSLSRRIGPGCECAMHPLQRSPCKGVASTRTGGGYFCPSTHEREGSSKQRSPTRADTRPAPHPTLRPLHAREEACRRIPRFQFIHLRVDSMRRVGPIRGIEPP